MDWLNTLMMWSGPIIWLTMGGYAFRHHIEQDTTKPDNVTAIFLFSLIAAPASFGIAVWEIKNRKPALDTPAEGG